MEEDVKVRERVRERVATKEKTAPAEGSPFDKCPHCGAPIHPDFELCPVCGGKLVDYCTFCGAPMTANDVDCPECGMPAEGVMCPSCHIRNYRPYCRQCSQPLSKAARRAVEKAKQDPKVQEAARLLKRVAELQAELEGAVPENEAEYEEPQGPTEGELRLQELMSKVGFKPAETPKATTRKMGRTREEVMAEYQNAVEDANKILAEMLPPAGSTPQEQRNYYTARKVAVMEIVEEKWFGIPIEKTMGWICNRCQVLHRNPSECAVREFGGKWITCTDTKVVPEGTPGAIEYSERVEKGIVYKRE